jgi:excisionase family DNA binding protein
MKESLLLSVREAAAFLGMTQDALRARIKRRVVPFRRLGGRVIFLRSELEQYIARLPGVDTDEALHAMQSRHERA